MDSTKTILVFYITTCNLFYPFSVIVQIFSFLYFLRCFLALGGVDRTLICSRWNSSLW